MYIPLTASYTQRVGSLQQWIAQLAQVWGQGQQLAGVLNAMVTNGSYTQIETLFGLSTGQGETLYNLVVGANAAINVSAVTQLINEVG